jgi:hypothetical protein
LTMKHNGTGRSVMNLAKADRRTNGAVRLFWERRERK